MNSEDLAIKIATSDVKGLSSVKGLGKKTAERIILELREKIGAVSTQDSDILVGVNSAVSVDQDALLALLSLGFTKTESEKVLRQASANGIQGVQQLIGYALKNIK